MEINKDWRYKRQDCFDITKRPLIPFTFDENRLVYENVNLSIFTTPVCNAKCDFCVAELRYLNTGIDFIKPTIKDDEEYFTRLEAVIKRIRPINPSVSLTGGEPTNCPRLTRIVELLNQYDIRKRTITTNGTGLLIKQNGKYPLDLLIENGFQHLNISHAHYDYDRNISLMKYSKSELPHELLKEIVSISNPAGLRARLSCVLIQEGINGVPEMKKYMEFAESMGVDNVVFRELMKYDLARIKAGRILDFCERNRVDLTRVWEDIDNDPDFTFINQVLGYYYYVEVYKYHNIDVLFRASEYNEIARIGQFGTDRGGFNNNKKWRETNILFEDVIFGTTIADILEGEENENVSTSFKKFKIIEHPILLVYDINCFENVGYHEWKFKNPDNKLDCLKQIIILC